MIYEGLINLNKYQGINEKWIIMEKKRIISKSNNADFKLFNFIMPMSLSLLYSNLKIKKFEIPFNIRRKPKYTG